MNSLNPKELYTLLCNKNKKYFFYANTVKTSYTFIEHNGLMSCGYIEDNGLVQTTQSSD